MKKCCAVLCVLLGILQWGCGNDVGQASGQDMSEQSVSGQNMSGQSISASETGEDSAGAETVSGDSYVLLPDQYEAYEFYVVSGNILNYEDAVAEMVIARPEERERKVVSFCDTFPKELQEAFRYEIEHFREVEVHFGEYNTGLEWHAIEEFPYEIPSDISYMFSVRDTDGYEFSYQKIDLDGDGEEEYFLKVENCQRPNYKFGHVYKIVDGKPVLCFVRSLKELGMESLYYEGDYYLYIGNALVRCGEGCDLLTYRYEENKMTYSPELYSIENSCLDYIVAVAEKGDFIWHEGYRAEGYEETDFKSYLPDGLENHLPSRWSNYPPAWYFEAADTSWRGRDQFFERFCLPVEVEGKDFEYLFLRRENAPTTDKDVIVAVLVPEGDDKYTIACMYSLIYTDEFYLIDKREYIDELVAADHLAYYCEIGWEQNDSYDELAEAYQPNSVTYPNSRCHSFRGYPLMAFSYGEGKTAVVAVHGEEFEVIYDENDNAESRFLEPCNILEHILDQEVGTESYLYYDICTNDYMDNFTPKIVLKDSFIRVDEDRDGLFTEADSYYCNGYELDQYTWERWQVLYRNYSSTQ